MTTGRINQVTILNHAPRRGIPPRREVACKRYRAGCVLAQIVGRGLRTPLRGEVAWTLLAWFGTRRSAACRKSPTVVDRRAPRDRFNCPHRVPQRTGHNEDHQACKPPDLVALAPRAEETRDPSYRFTGRYESALPPGSSADGSRASHPQTQ